LSAVLSSSTLTVSLWLQVTARGATDAVEHEQLFVSVGDEPDRMQFLASREDESAWAHVLETALRDRPNGIGAHEVARMSQILQGRRLTARCT
jgi:hypothetical protein